MQESATKKLSCSDIGYHGRSIDNLTKEELLEAFLDLVQKVHECAERGNKCKDVFTVCDE
jgi:hypothetical protein